MISSNNKHLAGYCKSPVQVCSFSSPVQVYCIVLMPEFDK